MITRYSIQKKDVIEDLADVKSIRYDYFISAYEDCERVQKVFNNIDAEKKIWVLFPQYDFKKEIEVADELFSSDKLLENEFIQELFEKYGIEKSKNIAIDITGFIRPHLIFLVRYLAFMEFTSVTIFYTEPQQYVKADETDFSGFIDEVKVIEGCGSSDNSENTDNDILIIGAGYDDKLVAKIAQNKRNCKIKYEIFGFPSLQPDMYQESILKTSKVRETIGENTHVAYAPANDPFMTAEILKQIIDKEVNATNIYLSPLASKPQVLGFAYYFAVEGYKKPISILYPVSKKYLLNTTVGTNRTWRYELEFYKD